MHWHMVHQHVVAALSRGGGGGGGDGDYHRVLFSLEKFSRPLAFFAESHILTFRLIWFDLCVLKIRIILKTQISLSQFQLLYAQTKL
jgi:hypothetical protein